MLNELVYILEKNNINIVCLDFSTLKLKKSICVTYICNLCGDTHIKDLNTITHDSICNCRELKKE